MVVITWIVGLFTKGRKWLKRAKWLKANGAWIVVALLAVALVLVTVGYLKARDAEKTYRLRIVELNETKRLAIVNKDEKATEDKSTGKSTTKSKTTAEFYDDAGALIARLDHEAESSEEFDRLMKDLTKETPKIDDADPAPTGPAIAPAVPAGTLSAAGLYPLGVFFTINDAGDMAVGPTWRLIPRVKLWLVPDPCVTIGVGIEKRGSSLGGRVGAAIGFHRN